jgi:hypothetical protein
VSDQIPQDQQKRRKRNIGQQRGGSDGYDCVAKPAHQEENAAENQGREESLTHLLANDIGEEECKKICAWTYNEMKFDYVGHNRYYYADSAIRSKASFIAQDLLDEARYIYPNTSSVKTGGWKETDLRTWMNSKLFSGVSVLWRQILSPVVINSIQNTKEGHANAQLRQQITQSNNYFYLPSIAEVTTDLSSEATAVFKLEFANAQDSVYPVFGNGKENRYRVKKLNNTPAIWWLRSPYYHASAESSTLNNFNAVTSSGVANNTTYWNEVLDTESIDHYFNVVNPYGICVCFSI